MYACGVAKDAVAIVLPTKSKVMNECSCGQHYYASCPKMILPSLSSSPLPFLTPNQNTPPDINVPKNKVETTRA
jgi:hypothetical protein